jgi:hypothetical protein
MRSQNRRKLDLFGGPQFGPSSTDSKDPRGSTGKWTPGTMKADPIGIQGKMIVGVQMGTRRNVPSRSHLYTHNCLILYSNWDHLRGPSRPLPVQPPPTPDCHGDILPTGTRTCDMCSSMLPRLRVPK